MSTVSLTAQRRRRAPAILRAHPEPGAVALVVLYVLWALTLFDPHRWFASMGPLWLKSVPTVWYGVLVLVLLLRLPAVMSSFRTNMLAPPLLAFLGAVALSIPNAIYTGKAREIAQIVLLYYILAVATLILIRHPRQLIPILLMFPLQFVWWAFHGQARGLIKWHYILANYNGFGALMVLGIALCFYFALGTKSRLLKGVGFAFAGYCVLGVVTSFARGAFLAAALVAGVIWLRSPRKLLTSAALIVGTVLVVGGSAMFVTQGSYFGEMKTAFEQGTEAGTGGHRWALWQSAFRMFAQNPLVGVGGGNFGVYVVQVYGFETVKGYESAAKLWNRDLHSIYVQVLTEFGVLGMIPFIWMIVDFWKRNRALRRPAFLQAWKSSAGDLLQLRHVSLALEGAMIAFLATGVMYGQLFHHWFFTLLAANLALYWSLRRQIAQERRRAGVTVPEPPARVPLDPGRFTAGAVS